MKEKLERCFARLQKLNITATVDNMETLLQTLYDLRDVYNKIEKDGENDADNGTTGNIE